MDTLTPNATMRIELDLTRRQLDDIKRYLADQVGALATRDERMRTLLRREFAHSGVRLCAGTLSIPEILTALREQEADVDLAPDASPGDTGGLVAPDQASNAANSQEQPAGGAPVAPAPGQGRRPPPPTAGGRKPLRASAQCHDHRSGHPIPPSAAADATLPASASTP